MHELGIVESALGVVREHCAARGAGRVERVVLRVGSLSAVDPEALRFAFQALSPGTVAEGAILDIEAVAAAAYCARCAREFSAEGGFIFVCPTCGDLCGEIRRGRELELSRIEMT